MMESHAPASRRLFVGLELPRNGAEALAAAARAALDPADWRVYAPGDLHLTLCFLGEVAESTRPGLEACLREQLAGAPAFRGAIRGTGAFGPRGRARALWAGLELEPGQRARLLDLVARTESAVRAAGIPFAERREPGEVTPHVTLARPRGKPGRSDALGELDLALPWSPDEVLLFESLRPAAPAARYAVLARFPLDRGGDPASR